MGALANILACVPPHLLSALFHTMPLHQVLPTTLLECFQTAPPHLQCHALGLVVCTTILPLSMLWISQSTHCTAVQPWCNQHEEASSDKCSQNIAIHVKWWPFVWVTKEIVNTCGRGPCPVPAACHTETETRVRCTKMRPRGMGSAYGTVTRRWKLWRRSGSRFKYLDW